MKVWVTRSKNKSAGTCPWLILIWPIKPFWNGETDGWNSTEDCDPMEVRVAGFKKLFGFTPRKGSCKQYNLELKEIV